MQLASAIQWIIPIAGIAAVLFAIYLARDVLSRDQGTQAMQDVAGTIYEGAVAFIRRQYTTIAILALVVAVVVGDRDQRWSKARRSPTPSIYGVDLGVRTGIAFLVGAACSMASGHHRHVHQRQVQRPHGRGRPPQPRRGGPGRDARRRRLRLPRGRPVAARRVVDVRRSSVGLDKPSQAPFLIVGYGFGASFVALFAQLGGGIYTKAADVGSDLVGKVEKGIPEDDPRNAARHRRPRRRQRRRLRRPRRGPLRVHGRREHRRHDPGRRRLRHRPGRRLAQPRVVDLLPARRPRVRPAGHHRLDLLRPRPRGRGPDEHAQPRLLGDDRPVRGRACSS